MASPTVSSIRLLPDGTPLHNRLLAALPAIDYVRIQKHLRMNTGRDRPYAPGTRQARHRRLFPEWGCVLGHESNA